MFRSVRAILMRWRGSKRFTDREKAFIMQYGSELFGDKADECEWHGDANKWRFHHLFWSVWKRNGKVATIGQCIWKTSGVNFGLDKKSYCCDMCTCISWKGTQLRTIVWMGGLFVGISILGWENRMKVRRKEVIRENKIRCLLCWVRVAIIVKNSRRIEVMVICEIQSTTGCDPIKVGNRIVVILSEFQIGSKWSSNHHTLSLSGKN